MKNFKKVIAFLMVAAMTLGMGVTAFAEDYPLPTTECVKVTGVEEASAGSQVKIQVVAATDLCINSAALCIVLDPEKVEASVDAIKGIDANYDSAYDEWNTWKATYGGSKVLNYNESASPNGRDLDYVMVHAMACTSNRDASIPAGTVMAEMVVTLKTDVAAGDQIGFVALPGGITDNMHGTETPDASGNPIKKLFSEDVPVVVIEKASSSSSDTGSSSSSSASGSTASQPTTAATGDNTTAAKGDNTTAATAKDIVTKDDALNALDTLAKATAAGAKLNKAAFANDADYQAFTKALADANKVLNNAKATDAEKAAALKTLKDAMAKADEKALVAAVKAVVNTTPATTKAGNGKTKTGDTAPVAVLMLVAIAAFGTAVVVYRKKVNA